MVTKAGQLQLRDIKQGKQGWLVRVSRRGDRPPHAFSVELVRFRRRPYLKKCDFPEFRSASPIIAFDPMHKPVLRGYHVTMSAQVYGLCAPDKSYYRLPEDRRPLYLSRFFNTKEAALRYAHSINGYPNLQKKAPKPVAKPQPALRDIRDVDMLALLSLSNQASLESSNIWLDAFKPKPGSVDLGEVGRELPALGPRGHVLDPLDLLDFGAPIRRNLLVCECGDTRQFPFYLGVTCERCGTEFKQQNEETPLLESLKWEKLKKELEAVGLPRATHLVAEMPLHPPIRLMDGMTNGIEPIRHLSILRGKRRQSTGNEKFNIRSFGEIDFPMPPEHTGIKLAYKGVEPHKTEEEYKYGVELNLGMMGMPAVQDDAIYNSAYKAYQDYLLTQPKITYHIDTQGQPLNMYGSESNFKPFPDINELPQDENGLVALRKHENWGGKGVIVRASVDSPADEMGNRIPDFIFEPAMPCQHMLDYMSGKITLTECEIRRAESRKRVAELLGETVEQKPFVDNNPTNEWDPNLDGMALLAIESGIINEDQYTLIRCRDDSTGFITAFQELSKKVLEGVARRLTAPTDFTSNFAADHISGNWYVTTRDKRLRVGRIIDKEEYERRMADNNNPTEE